MADTGCPPLIVEGDWSPAQNKTMKNKLQLYFQSKKKSGGGDCRVEAEDGAPRAEVYFISEEVREQVLARTNHEIVLENQTVKLRLISASSLKDSDDASDSKTKTKSEVKPGGGASAESKEDKDTKVEKVTSVQSVAVVLENVDSMSRDLLSMLVENISGLEDSAYSLEIIWETNRAVITFNSPADVEKFLTVSQSSQKLQKYGLTARPLEAAKSVRLESLPPTVTKDVLELYSEKSWSLPVNIIMIPSEQAAIVAFSDPKVVQSICTKDNYVICSTTVKVYPYYESLGTALYGKERPTWKMPEPFTERVHPAVWKFLKMKKQLKIINDQMSLHFCSVDLDNPEVKLSPLPSFLRQKGLTAKHVDMWMSTHLREVVIVVHPSDSQTVDCFTRAFRGQTDQRNMREAQEFNEAPVASVSQSQQPSASFSQVSSPSLGVHRMQMGQLTLEVSSGDITKEASDVIINSSSPDFTLKAGVSKAILDSAGLNVEMECAQIVNSPGYQPQPMILTSAGQLPSKNIIHIVGRNDPAQIKDMVNSVLKVCEENKFKSVSFPALGTGQGGASPSAVADAMVGAVVEFVRNKQPKFVRSVKFLIFQTFMVTEFQKSMMKREEEGVEEKNVFTKIKDPVPIFVSTVSGTERRSSGDLVLEREEFEPTVFQLCADNKKAVSLAKKRIQEVIVAEQAERTITDQYISQLSQADMDQLKALQRELTVSIRLDKGQEDQEPKIHLEGLTRDVFTAEATVRDIIRKVERTETLRNKALLVSGLVEWQFQHDNKATVPFDIYTNLNLEEALEKKQSVKIKIDNENYNADAVLRKAVSEKGNKMVELLRKDLKGTDAALPPHWDDMKGDLLKLFPLTTGSQEYNDVETEVKKTGLAANIISIDRVQNTTLWQSYQLLKKQLEVKNQHTNNERRLFHGTGANSINLINNQGFNRSYAGTQVGAMYGNGSYFAEDPGYSANGYATPDAKGHKRMYLARVLVGDFTEGKSGMITPPPKSSSNSADLYDSVVDQTPNPTMFVIFNDIQAYPEYLITFT
ncbi:protein mono-ADP-ribosyltransferase PARP14-like [Micropterus dolomieu]|uniref:protein mono-ADP-ribosyltransferase PARP14-like n=1 Tax=Micropterus dolomieu TaxID=147949 RepID=UPI001E8DBBEF|nr:protein mono-ADP-ribosyltransferase PARP14-like [Micropterus dolomieu]